ncbi:hypothetical protein J1C54_15155 [Alcanivorax sp. 1008]|nr:hypothetical protein [Alcanivorax sp. 1008]
MFAPSAMAQQNDSASVDLSQIYSAIVRVAQGGEDLDTLSDNLEAYVAGGNEDNFLVGSASNYLEYYLEAVSHLEQQGGRKEGTPVPQNGYDGVPFHHGVLQVAPEIGPLGTLVPPQLNLAWLALEIPVIPTDWGPGLGGLPDVPAINRAVTGVTEEEGWTLPHVPALRWTADGRVGMNAQVGGSACPNSPDNCPGKPSDVPLFLYAPEKLNQPFVQSPKGPSALVLDKFNMSVRDLTQNMSEADWVTMSRGLPLSERHKGLPGVYQMSTICDAFEKDPGERRNPYSCGAGGRDDCYDVTVIGAYHPAGNFDGHGNPAPRLEKESRLVGTDVTIRVTDPKTAAARIADVEYGTTRIAPNRTGIIFEPLTPADGRLLVGRRGWLPLVWMHGETQQIQHGMYDTVYSVAPESARACDVTELGDFKPISHAPYDPQVKTRYDFAAQPFRDATGRLIKDGTDIKGTYPWMDKEAKMFSVQVSPANLYPYGRYNVSRRDQSRYPARCVGGSCRGPVDQKDVDETKDNMFMIVGAWTQGKMVLVDGLLNPADYRISAQTSRQSWLKLYSAGTGLDPSDSGEVRVGSVRGGEANFPVMGERDQVIGRYNPHNLSVLDSMENRLNYLPEMKPSRFQDVVWNMSAGHHTVEFAFDDYLNPDGFIVSNMVALFEHNSEHWFRMRHYDGWRHILGDFGGEVRIQNSATATSDRWTVPAYGRVRGGRLEPVANGGVRGKGLWFDGSNTRVDYDVPAQARNIHGTDWFYSLFIDPRFGNDGTQRVLIDFPDNSQLRLLGQRELQLINRYGELVRSVRLPKTAGSKQWTQIGLSVGAEQSGGRQTLQVFVDGFLVDDWTGNPRTSALQRGNFRPGAGTLSLGRENGWRGVSPFRGWMDEFKVFAWAPNPEVVCNFAHGTLVGLPDSYSGSLATQAGRYSAAAHDYVSDELAEYGQQTYPRYACYHDNSRDNGAHQFNVPVGVAHLREAFNFPEGPLYHDAPRPDSSSNAFCLSCHTDDSKVRGLKVSALNLIPVLDAKLDFRRQPTQPPAKVYGNLPAYWFPGAPAHASDAGFNGQFIDEWALASAAGRPPLIHNVALADSNGDPLRGVQPGDVFRPSEVKQLAQAIRANTNGLTRQVAITVNGSRTSDNSVPFTAGNGAIRNGHNTVRVEAWNDAGQKATRDFSLIVEEWARSASQGGNGGGSFDYSHDVIGSPSVTSVVLRGGSWMDQVGMEYSDGTVLRNGGWGGGEARLDLSNGEYIRSVEVCRRGFGFWERLLLGTSDLVGYVKVTTSQGRSISKGGRTSSCATYSAPSGRQITGFYGRAGAYLDRLGVLYGRR